MSSYQVPSRTVQNVFCRRQPTPLSCLNDEYIYNPERPTAPVSLLEVKTSSLGENAGRGLFAKVHIAPDTYLGGETAAHPVHFSPTTYELIFKLYDTCDYTKELEILAYYMDSYGFTMQKFVSPAGFFLLLC